MVSTATPAERANCSIRYSTSIYSSCEAGAAPSSTSSVRVPVVHPVEPAWIGAVSACEGLHRVDIVVIVVVLEDRVAHVVGRAVADEVTRGREDRVVRIVDVSAQPVLSPRAGQELHRTLCARRRDVLNAAEVALDEID